LSATIKKAKNQHIFRKLKKIPLDPILKPEKEDVFGKPGCMVIIPLQL
jgi:hypothetical protein